ncbi:hypothetical protein MMC10_006681 [Thelotrema lepadinum]|nr:hypothetical protein [Thelotrema lepadinum]
MASCLQSSSSHLTTSTQFFALLWLATAAAAQGILSSVSPTKINFSSPRFEFIRGTYQVVVHQSLLSSFQEHPILWEMVALCTACSFVHVLRWRYSHPIRRRALDRDDSNDSKDPLSARQVDDPGLLRKHSRLTSYPTSVATYNGVRTFYRPHAQADKLPTTPKPLPLLVFIHGLGGSLAQYSPLLTSLVNIGPCLGIDLPGCGLSEFTAKDWDAYSQEALSELLEVVIGQICEISSTKEVVLIGHSMGCSLAVALASRNANQLDAKFQICGLIAICPKATAYSEAQIKTFERLLSIPSPIFDLWRMWDRRGGLNSHSVTRMVGKGAHEDTKKLQLRFNEQSRTNVWRRMAWGAVPTLLDDGTLKKGLPGPEIWGQLSIPVFLVAGEDDKVTPPSEINIIAHAMGKEIAKQDPTLKSFVATNDSGSRTMLSTDARPSSSDLQHGNASHMARSILKTSILPSPASHALLYDTSTYRTLSGLVQDFLADHVDKRLSLGWQLQYLKESNKWDVKNLAKWKAIKPISEPIAGIFRAMKTLREVDEVHAPAFFVEKWRDKVAAIIDISYESPVYNPKGLEDGGIEYHKFPTVSKVPPTVGEVKDFVAMVDRLRSSKAEDSRLVGVHCHYGFNRTGFFICCYLIEREGYSVQGALDEFAKGRPPGIRHEHFIDTLFVRYCVGLQRAPTF